MCRIEIFNFYLRTTKGKIARGPSWWRNMPTYHDIMILWCSELICCIFCSIVDVVDVVHVCATRKDV